MAAMRSALVMLSRRACGSSGSSAATSMVGGRRLDMHQVFRPSAPPPALHRPSPRNLMLQGLHRFSTSGMECADQRRPLLMHKAGNALRLWWQRSSDHVKNYGSTISGDPYVKNYRSTRVFGTIIGLAFFCYMVMIPLSIQHQSVDRSHNTRIRPLHSHGMNNTNVYCFMPPYHPCHRFCRRQEVEWMLLRIPQNSERMKPPATRKA